MAGMNRGRHRRDPRTTSPQAIYPHFTLRAEDHAATSLEPATAAHYSRYIGRVGALAVALGIGVVVGTGHHGLAVAYADTDSASDDSKVSTAEATDSSASDSAPTSPSTSASTSEAGGTSDSDTQTSDDPGTGGMQVSSSGGRIDSDDDTDQVTDADELPADDDESAGEDTTASEPAGEPETTPADDAESAPTEQTDATPARSDKDRPAAEIGSQHDTFTPAASDTTVIDSTLQSVGRAGATSVGVEDVTLNQVAHHATIAPPTIPSATAVNPLQAVLAVPMAVIDLAHTVVAALLTPIFGHPSAPTHPPMLWAMLEFVRREVQRTFFNWTPIAINQEITLVLPPGGESGPISFHVHDFDGDNLRYYVPTQGVPGGPTHGSVTVDQATGTFTYTPDPGFTGTDEFRLTVSDAHTRPHLHGLLGFLRPHWGHTDSAKIRITVVAATLPPTPNNDVFVTEQGVPATGNVLANDTDPNGETLTAAPLVEPQYGRLTLQPDGSFLYEPDPEYSGEDVFLYTAYNSAAGAPARVAIIITPVNRPPVGTDDEYVITEDSQATGNVLANDSDPDGDSFTAVLDTAPSHGTVQLNADGSFVYTPNANFTGTDAFSYVATDGELTGAPTLVRITVTPVNDDPVANPDSYTVNEDAVLVGNVLANDVDVDGDPLTVTPGAGTANGQLQWHSNGSFTYTPNANFHGTDSFTYTVTDSHGATSGPATVTITVNPVNDAPVAVNDSFTVTEDGTLTNNVLTNDSDVDGDSLTASVVSNPAHGTLTLESDGSFTYKPNENYYGTDSFSYTVSDGTATSAPAVVTITVTPVNDAPVAQDDVYVVAEDGTLSGNLLTNDSDVDGNPLSVSTVTQPGHGTVAFNPDGSFTYTPAADFNGTDTFTYTVIDGKGGSDTGLVTVTVTPVNDAPVSQDDFYSTPEDSPLTGNVLDNDHDIDGDALTAVLVMPPSHGDVTLNEDGTFTYTPAPDFNGVDYFYYSVSDGVVDSDASIVIISVTPVNDPPVAQDDSYTINQDSVLTGNVLSNDTDKDNNPLTATLVSPAANGTVTLNADGTFTYIPNSGFHGEDSFTYIASDNAADSEVATVRITVRDINHAPVAANDTFTTNEDTPKTGSVLDNDTDSDGDPLTAQLVSGPSNGTLTLNPDGTFSYTPNANFHGVDSFTYKASDGLLTSNTATVTITVASVNDLPVAGPDSYTINEDSTLTGNVLGNDTDPDGDGLSVILATEPKNGTVTLDGDGTFTYTPAPNFNGGDTFTYLVSDGQGGTAIGTVTITVTAVDDPVQAVEITADAVEDGATATGNILTANNAANVDDEVLTVTPGSGVTANGGTWTIDADGEFTYTPAENFNGTDSFSYTISDGATSSTGVVTITVTAVNDPVSAVEFTGTGIEDGPAVTGNVLTANNAANVDDEILTVTPDSGVTANGGTWTIDADGEFTYTPAENFNGTDSFSYTISDGTYSDTGTITITIAAVNDAPVAGDDTVTTEEDTPYTGTLPISDADGDPLTIEVGTEPEYGALTIHEDGTFTYTPTTNYNGDDSFTYTVTDGKGGTATGTITITITPVNDDPTAEDDTFTFDEDHQIESSVTVHDVDGDSLTVTLDDPPSNGTLDLNADGTFTYTPNPNYHGTDSFTYTVSDGKGGIATGTVTFNIQPVNDAPIAHNDNFTVPEEGTLQDSVIGNDIDVDDDSITVSLVDGPKNGTLTLNPDGSFTYVPNVDFYGTDTFTYEASDGELTSNTALVTIVVTNVNDAPVANDDSFTVDEDTELTMDVLANDVDADKDALTVVGVVSGPSSGTLTLNEDGTFTYTPDLNFNGTDTFTYEVSDGQGGTDTALVTISVTSVNDAPVAGTDTYTVNEDTVLTVPVGTGLLANDTDVDGGTLSATLTTEPAHGTVTVNTDGSFTYTPVANYNGTDSFTYTVSDGQGGTAVGTVNITVIAVNDAPVAVTDNYSVNEDTVLTVPAGTGLLANDTDVDGGALTVIANTNPAHGTLTLNPNGTFTYTPHENYNGTDSFTYTVSDGQGGTAVGTVNITVNPVNDRPVAVNDSFSTDEDTPLNGNVLTNDIDVDGDALSATLVMGPNNGTLTLNSNGTFTYTPNANFYGTDTFFYRVNDGTVNGQTAGVVTITVTPVNDPPVAANDSFTVAEDTTYSGNVLSNDSDVDGNPLTVISHTDPSHGTLNLNPNGTFTYTPHQDYHGTDSFTYTVSDGQGGTADATVDITVTPVNDRPVAVNDSFTTDEDTPVTGNVLTNDFDPDGNNTIQSAEVVTGPSNGTLTFNSTTGEFTYTPGLNFNGTDSFTYTISDGSLTSEEATVTITVEPVNDPPVAVNDTIATNEDTQVTGNVLTNDTDPEGKATIVSAAVVTGPSNGTLTFNETTGEFTYTPNANFNGTDSFTYEITDNSGAVSNTATVTINVIAVDDPPAAVNDTVTIPSGNTITINVSTLLANDTDIDGGPMNFVGVSNPVGGTVTYNETAGTVTFTRTTTGPASFMYTIGNGSQTSTATVTIVDNVAPKAIDVQTINKNGGTQGLMEQGDTIVFTFSEPIDPASIIANWDGSPRSVYVRAYDDNLLLNLLGNQDSLEVFDMNGALLPLGTVGLGASNYVTGVGSVLNLLTGVRSLTFGEPGTATPSTMTVDGNTIRVVLGSYKEGESLNLLGIKVIISATEGTSSDMTWTPGAGITDLAGNPINTTPAAETGGADKNF